MKNNNYNYLIIGGGIIGCAIAYSLSSRLRKNNNSVITAFVFNIIFSSPLSFIWVLIFGLAIGIAAIFGDLAESSIKRGGGVKDSGGLVPGHGGIMDRFDSFFFVFPVAYYLTVLFYYSKGVGFY